MKDYIEKCLLLLNKLDQLIADGEGDSKQADDIRDQMDPLWYKMTEAEQSEMKQEYNRRKTVTTRR